MVNELVELDEKGKRKRSCLWTDVLSAGTTMKLPLPDALSAMSGIIIQHILTAYGFNFDCIDYHFSSKTTK